ncbi:MAG: hypothetical protein HY525_17775 [Betaproteobacteria bacterium]|nr:hypothetical protein [Betaproteobacteria bacterium]
MKTLLLPLLGLALAAPCHAGTRGLDQEKRWHPEQDAADVQPQRWAIAQSDARGMDFDVYIRLQTGMSEGELLLRAGKPDSESIENFRNDIVKTYYYFPTVSNPWITVITLRGGRVANIERTKKTF